MRRDDISKTPQTAFTGTKAFIESWPNPTTGMEAIATDTSPLERGVYNGTSWEWGTTSSGSLPVLTGNRVVVTDNDGVIATVDELQFDYDRKYLLLSTIDESYLPTHGGGVFYLMGSTEVPGTIGVSHNDSTSSTAGTYYVQGWRSGGTPESKEAVSGNMGLLRLTGRGWDGVGWSNTQAQVLIVSDDLWTEFSHPTRIDLYTTASGSVTQLVSFSVLPSGGVNIPYNSTYNVGGVPHTHNPSEVGLVATSGWEQLTQDAWYISPTVFAIETDMRSTFKQGTKVKVVLETGEEVVYGIVLESTFGSTSYTEVELIATSDYELSDDTILRLYVNIVQLPEDFPHAFSWPVSITNFEIGNGTLEATFSLNVNRVDIVLEATLGSSSVLDGPFSMSLPISTTNYLTPYASIGTGTLVNWGTSVRPASVILTGSTSAEVRVSRIVSDEVVLSSLNDTVPFVWSEDDIITLSATYFI